LNLKNFPHHSIKDICWLLNSFSSILQLSKHCLWQFVLCLFYQPGFDAHTTNANCYSSKVFFKISNGYHQSIMVGTVLTRSNVNESVLPS
jgi:hypothetical protein